MIFEIPLGLAAFLFLLVLGFTRSWKRALQVALWIAAPLAIAFVVTDALGIWWLFHKIESGLTDAGWTGDAHLLKFFAATLTLSSYALGRMLAWMYRRLYARRGMSGVITGAITGFVLLFAVWNLALYFVHRVMTPAPQASQRAAAPPLIVEIVPRRAVHVGNTDITFDSCAGSGPRVVCTIQVVNQADHDESLAWSSDVMGTDSQGETHASSRFDVGGQWPAQEKLIPHVTVSAHVQFDDVAEATNAFQDLRLRICCAPRTHWWNSGDEVIVDLAGPILWSPPQLVPSQEADADQPPVLTADQDAGGERATLDASHDSAPPDLTANVELPAESKAAAAPPQGGAGPSAQTDIFLIIAQPPDLPIPGSEPNHRLLKVDDGPPLAGGLANQLTPAAPASADSAGLLLSPSAGRTLGVIPRYPGQEVSAIEQVRMACGEEPSPKARPVVRSDYVWCRFDTLRSRIPASGSKPK